MVENAEHPDGRLATAINAWCDTYVMKKKSVRITLDIPASLHQQLEKHAAASGKPVCEILLEGVERVVSAPIRLTRSEFSSRSSARMAQRSI